MSYINMVSDLFEFGPKRDLVSIIVDNIKNIESAAKLNFVFILFLLPIV